MRIILYAHTCTPTRTHTHTHARPPALTHAWRCTNVGVYACASECLLSAVASLSQAFLRTTPRPLYQDQV